MHALPAARGSQPFEPTGSSRRPAAQLPPGVHIRRRALLRAGLALPAALLLQRLVAAHSPRTQALDDELLAFVDAWASRADALVAGESAEPTAAGAQAAPDDPAAEALLHELCAALASRDPAGFPARFRDAYVGRGMITGPVGGRGALSLLEVVIEPGRELPVHNHVGYDFITLGLGGEAQARHFEPAGAGKDPGSELHQEFTVREVSSTLLVPGRTTTLTRTRANIHGFRAGSQGARMLDIGIHHAGPGAGPQHFSVLEVDEQPSDAQARLYTARWIGNIYAMEKVEAQRAAGGGDKAR